MQRLLKGKLLKMKYYIYDVNYPGEAYVFYNNETGDITPAIYDSEIEANLICNRLNTDATFSSYYNVGQFIISGEEETQ